MRDFLLSIGVAIVAVVGGISLCFGGMVAVIYLLMGLEYVLCSLLGCPIN